MTSNEFREWERETAGLSKVVLELVEEVTPDNARAEGAAAAAVPYKLFMPQNDASMSPGDCTVSHIRYRLYQNGNTRWECDVSSTDSGDELRANVSGGEAPYGANNPNGLLFWIGQPYWFDIHDKNTTKHCIVDFGADQTHCEGGLNHQQVYQRTTRVVFYCQC